MRGIVRTIVRRIRPVRPRPVILMYHRIAAPAVDPWGLAVRPDHFEEHVSILGRTRRPLLMSDFVDRLDRGVLPDDAVAVTFDDGYVDNLCAAKPRLEAEGVPATIFVTTGALGQRTEYWWDELARLILRRRAALDCQLMIAGECCRVAFENAAPAESSLAWRAWEPPRSARETSYLDVWRRLRVVAPAERASVMSLLRTLLDAAPPDAQDLPMSPAQVTDAAAGGRVEIGAHTVTHPVLPSLDAGERRRELLDSRRDCEQLVSANVSGFAYPYGSLDAECRSAVQECGFRWACSTESRAVPLRNYDRFALPRVMVHDWAGAAFARALADPGGGS